MSKFNNTSYAISTVANTIDSFFHTTDGNVFNQTNPYCYKETWGQPTYYYSTSYTFPVTKKDYPDYPICNHFVNKETGENIIEIAVTGFSKNELKVKVKDEYLVVTGNQEEKIDLGLLKEVYHGIPKRDFEVKFQIPDKLDSEKIASIVENGILKIFVPMKEEVLKKNRDIEIK
jgi:HSP20 family molecular chaperone IbpA